MPRHNLPRLPAGPLRRQCELRGTSINKLGLSIGMHRHQFDKELTWSTADKLACALGFHPALIWGDDWWAVAQHYESVAGDRANGYLPKEAA